MRLLLLILPLISSTVCVLASNEYSLPVKHSGGRAVRYFSDHELDAVDGDSEYAVVMVHGVSGGNDDCTQRVRRIVNDDSSSDKIYFVAPCFPTLSMLNDIERNRIVYWNENQWQAGNDSPVALDLSPYDVLDAIFTNLNDVRLYPKLKHVLFCGYSAGAQVVSRYMAVSRIKARDGLAFSFAAGAPSSWLFLDKNAPWHYGFNKKNRYASGLSNDAIIKNIRSRHIVCFCGTADTGTKNLSMNPSAMKQGPNRYERFKNFRKHVLSYKKLCDSFVFIEVEGVGHSGECWEGVGFANLVRGMLATTTDMGNQRAVER